MCLPLSLSISHITVSLIALYNLLLNYLLASELLSLYPFLPLNLSTCIVIKMRIVIQAFFLCFPVAFTGLLFWFWVILKTLKLLFFMEIGTWS
uniref:Uncharacterized protein n=1 Tax=Rhizophora mucronata TaxID=61149 RepID=A0A2P2M9N3_RHIMU